MKLKKLSAIILAVTAAACLGAGVAACGGDGECEHEVSSWSADPAHKPTCKEEGREYGLCSKCGEKVTRTVAANPADPALHDWDDWTVTVAPDFSLGGKAVRTCKTDSSHRREIDLPSLSSDKYTKSVKKQPTVFDTGIDVYTFADASGAVNVEIKTDRLEVDSVARAIEVGASKQSLVRSTAVAAADILQVERSASFYYGDGFVHLVDEGDNRFDEWYSHDANGRLFAVRARKVAVYDDPTHYHEEMKIENLDSASENNFKGFDFAFGIAGTERFYGADGLLNGLYELSQLTNGSSRNYREKLPIENEGKFGFTFDYIKLASNEGGSAIYYWCSFTVNFILDVDGMISYVYVNEDVYDYRGSGSHGEDVIYNEHVTYEQTAKHPSDPVVVNQYPAEIRYVQNMAVTYEKGGGNDVAVTADPVTVNAGERVRLTFSDITPDTASLSYDPLNVYLRLNGTDLKLSGNDEYKVIAVFLSMDNSVELNFHRLGEVVIVLKTVSGSMEKVITFNVLPALPARDELRVEQYAYSDAGGLESYTLTPVDTKDLAYSYKHHSGVYVGQPVAFKLTTEFNSDIYDFNYVGAVLDGQTFTATDKATLTAIPAGSPLAAVCDEKALVFNATEAGIYNLVFTITQDATRRFELVLVVDGAPDTAALLQDGDVYTAKLNSSGLKGDATVTVTGGDTSYDGTVRIDIGDKFVELSYVIDAVTGALSTQYKDGYKDGSSVTYKPYDFSLEVNSAYKLVLVHPTGFPTYDDNGTPTAEIERRVLELSYSSLLANGAKYGTTLATLNNEAVTVTLSGGADDPNDDNLFKGVATVEVGGKTVLLDYVYDKTVRSLTTAYKSGFQDPEPYLKKYNFSLTISQSRLILQHTFYLQDRDTDNQPSVDGDGNPVVVPRVETKALTRQQ